MKLLFGRQKRKLRIRKKISGTAQVPRLSVFRSNKFNYAQLINDDEGKTLVSISDMKDTSKDTKAQSAFNIGKELAKLAKAKGVNKVVFDKSGYKYHGRVKNIADGAREGGLEF